MIYRKGKQYRAGNPGCEKRREIQEGVQYNKSGGFLFFLYPVIQDTPLSRMKFIHPGERGATVPLYPKPEDRQNIWQKNP